MKKNHLYHRSRDYLLSFLYTQSVVTLVSLPILVSWGIPLSVMSPLGNLIFVPFLSTILFLSSCLFASFLVGYEPTYLIFALKKCIALWQWFLALNSPAWMIGFSFPGIAGLTGLSLISWFIIRSYTIRQHICREFLAPLVLVGYCFVLILFTVITKRSLPNKLIIPETDNQLTLVTDYLGTTTLSDRGFFTSLREPQKFVAYTLRPYLIKNYGITHIDKGKITAANKKTLTALSTLTTFYAPQQLDVPWFERLEKNEWHVFFSMKRKALEYSTTLKRFALPRKRNKGSGRMSFKKNTPHLPAQRQSKVRKERLH